MFFQVEISPVYKPKVIKKPTVEPEEVPILSLAPFTSIPKVFFDDVLVGTQASKTLVIHNPTPNDIMLHITKAPPEERCFELSWVEYLIRSQEKVELELFWQPINKGGWKDSLIFEDGGRIKKDVAVIFKAITPKKIKTKPRKVVKCVSTKVKSPRKWFSPKQKSPKSRVVLPDITNIPQINIEPPKYNLSVRNVKVINESTYVKSNKENFEISGIENLSLTSLCDIPNIKMPVKKLNSNNFNEIQENFEDSLETNKSPLVLTPNLKSDHNNWQTPLSMEDKLNALVLTPAITNFQPSLCSTGEKTRILTSEEMNYSNTSTATYTVGKPRSELNFEDKLANISSDTYIKNSDRGDLSSATFNIDRRSPELNTDDRLLNISSDTYIKGNISSSTYTKEGIQAELNFSSRSPSPISTEERRCQESVTQTEYTYQTEVVRTKQYLEQILEESYVSLDVSQLSRAESRKRRSNCSLQVTSPKRKSQIFNNCQQRLQTATNSSILSSKRTFKPLKGLNLKEVMRKSKERLAAVEESVVQSQTTKSVRHESESFTIHNPFILTAINSIDPFMSSTMYYDPKWVDEQENSFKKWLNALLTPPEELNSNVEGTQLDVVKLWQDCRKREVSKAPTKEVVSNKYHTKGRLESLRRTAGTFFRSPAISGVLSKICMMVENKKLVIREDKDIHLDLGLQAEIVSLFISYNPLWMRIGLETVYNTTIALNSNSDIMGLVMFLSEHFFKDQYLLKKYKSIHSKKYAVDIKKLVLKKFLMLIFLLDKAKESKLIPHDPCLFCKNAPFKESRDIILRFSRELLSSIGDVTKVIKHTGYVVSHKQTYIHEFDYAVNNLGADLRDGVRLTRVMEIILILDGLTSKLRVPAISRLQKVHNMKTVFDALQSSGFIILHEIEPKDIVDGHKEKTLSFLWQIIYKFQAPRINKAITTIQTFWRSLRVIIKRRILQRERLRKEQAAIKIQNWYRRMVLSRKLNQIIPTIERVLIEIRREKATITIQSNFRMILIRRSYLKLRKTIIKLQSYSRRYLVLDTINNRASAAVKIQSYFKMYIQKKRFLELKAAVTLVEQNYLAKKAMRHQLDQYQRLKSATLFIQTKIRAKLSARRDLETYIKLQSSTILIQRRFRANRLMIIERDNFLALKTSTIFVQQRYRANKQMEIAHIEYQLLRSSAILIQRRFRAQKQMIVDKNNYESLKRVSLVIQRQFRANRNMKQQRAAYLQLLQSTILIQEKFRAYRAMKCQRQSFMELREATLVIQNRFKAKKLMENERNYYLRLKTSVIYIQQKYRAKKQMQFIRTYYRQLVQSTNLIQQWYRGQKQMIRQRNYYQSLRRSTVTIQQRFRAQKQMILARNGYILLRQSTMIIQARFRANVLAKRQRKEYLELKYNVEFIQAKFKANRAMKLQRVTFVELRKATIVVQNRFRAIKLMEIRRDYYQNLRNAAVIVQRRFRAQILGKAIRKRYLELRNAVRVIEQHFIAYKLMKEQRAIFLNTKRAIKIIEERYLAMKLAQKQYQNYRTLKQAATLIQHKFRAKKQLITAQSHYVALKKATVSIQRRYRANQMTKIQRKNYLEIKQATEIIQARFRARKLMLIEASKYTELKKATIIIQQRFRANRLTSLYRREFLRLKQSVTIIEQHYQAKILAQKQYARYITIKQATIVIQKRFRARIIGRNQRQLYLKLLRSTTLIQRKFRANRSRKIQLSQYTELKNSTVIIQRRYNAFKLMRIHRNEFLRQKRAAVTIQSWFRAIKRGREVRSEYFKITNAVQTIQERFRAKKLAQKQFETFQTLKQCTIFVQKRFRANRLMRIEQSNYLTLQYAIKLIQVKFRANRLARFQRNNYLKLRKAAIVIQRRYIARKLMLTQKSQFQQLRQAATFVQCRFKYLRLKRAVATIERRYEAKILARKQITSYNSLRRATVVIQRAIRANISMRIERNKFSKLKQAAVVIQRRFRANRLMKDIRDRYQNHRNNAILIQRKYRANTLMRIERERFRAIRKASLTLQRRYRAIRMMRQSRHDYQILRKAAILLQRRYRAKKAMELEKARYIALRANRAAIVIQNFIRNALVMRRMRRDYLSLRKSVILMQTRFRVSREAKKRRKEYLELTKSVVLIQRLWRAKRTLRKTKHNIVIVQAYVRGFLARKIFSREYLPVLVEKKKRLAIQTSAAVKIQACWKGYRTRSLENQPELKNIRVKVKIVSHKVSPHKTLAYKKEKALDILVSNGSTLDQIISALQDLDYETRLFKESCLKLSECLPEELYMMITTSSRSVPEIQSCAAAASILVNFCKHSAIISNCWHPQFMDSVFTVMMHYCDKDYPLFLNLCTLVWHLARDAQRKCYIMGIRNISHKLAKIKQLCERKQKMSSKVHHMNVDIFAAYKHLPMPSTEPDYGLGYKKRPRMFKNAVHAMKSLMEVLGVHL